MLTKSSVLLSAILFTMTLAIAQGASIITPRPSVAPGGTICVNRVQNMSGQFLETNGIEDELAARIHQAGYRAGRLGELEACDANVYTEIVQLGGRKQMKAEVEFRLVLAGEQVPQMSTTAAGKSSRSFVRVDHPKAPRYREAIRAAFAEQARKIQSAQQGGVVYYAAAVEQ